MASSCGGALGFARLTSGLGRSATWASPQTHLGLRPPSAHLLVHNRAVDHLSSAKSVLAVALEEGGSLVASPVYEGSLPRLPSLVDRQLRRAISLKAIVGNRDSA